MRGVECACVRAVGRKMIAKCEAREIEHIGAGAKVDDGVKSIRLGIIAEMIRGSSAKTLG